MRFRQVAMAGLVAALACVLGWAFRGYLNPVHVAQWVSALQLCR